MARISRDGRSNAGSYLPFSVYITVFLWNPLERFCCFRLNLAKAVRFLTSYSVLGNVTCSRTSFLLLAPVFLLERTGIVLSFYIFFRIQMQKVEPSHLNFLNPFHGFLYFREFSEFLWGGITGVGTHRIQKLHPRPKFLGRKTLYRHYSSLVPISTSRGIAQLTIATRKWKSYRFCPVILDHGRFILRRSEYYTTTCSRGIRGTLDRNSSMLAEELGPQA